MKNITLINKENSRVAHEWLAFERDCPIVWDQMSDECKKKACDLAETQGIRCRAIFGQPEI